MCCLLTILVFLGPRGAIFFWWLVDQARWSRTFDTFVLPALGFVFLPWTTLMYVLVAPRGVVGFDWLWIALALFADIAFYAGGGYRNRRRIPGYTGY